MRKFCETKLHNCYQKMCEMHAEKVNIKYPRLDGNYINRAFHLVKTWYAQFCCSSKSSFRRNFCCAKVWNFAEKFAKYKHLRILLRKLASARCKPDIQCIELFYNKSKNSTFTFFRNGNSTGIHKTNNLEPLIRLILIGTVEYRTHNLYKEKGHIKLCLQFIFGHFCYARNDISF